LANFRARDAPSPGPTPAITDTSGLKLPTAQYCRGSQSFQPSDCREGG
jgi:hypothetical protein